MNKIRGVAMHEKAWNNKDNAPSYIGRIKRLYFLRGLGLGFLILNVWEAFWTFDRGKVFFALGHVAAAFLSTVAIFWTYTKTKSQ